MLDKSILIIDSDSDSLNALVDFFIKEAFTKAIGTNTSQDLGDILKNKRPSVILLNINMPGENSFDILKKIKEIDSNIDVIVFAEKGDVASAEKSLNIGASSYVVKSDSLSETAKKVMDVIKQRPSPRYNKQGITVLVADDSKAETLIVEKYLKSENYNCVVVNDAREVLNLTRSLRPHLVFLDIVMPGIDGIELLKQIKTVDKQIKVVMLSGISDMDVCTEAIRRGASGYVTKPFSLQQLGVAITMALIND